MAARDLVVLATNRVGTDVAKMLFMRSFRRPERVQLRIGNVLPDASGEIEVPVQFAAGTGTHEAVAQPPALPRSARRAATTVHAPVDRTSARRGPRAA
jgi:hypothetical protein